MVHNAHAPTLGAPKSCLLQSNLVHSPRYSRAAGFCFRKWRICIVAAGPAPLGPQSLTKPNLSQPQRPNGPPQLQLVRPPAGRLVGNGNGNGSDVPLRQITPAKPPGLPEPSRPPGIPGSNSVPVSVPPPPPPPQLSRPGPPQLPKPAKPLQASTPQAQQRQQLADGQRDLGAVQGGEPVRISSFPPAAPRSAPSLPPLARPGTAPATAMAQPTSRPPAAAQAPAAAAAAKAPQPAASAPPLPLPVANPFLKMSRPQATPKPNSNPFANIAPPPLAQHPAATASTPSIGETQLQRPSAPATAAANGAAPPLLRPPLRPTQGPPGTPPAAHKPLGRPTQPSRPGAPASGPASGAAAAGQAPQQLQLKRPPSRPDLLAQQPPATAPTTAAADAVDVPSKELIRPDPPSLRVLEPLMAGDAGVKPKLAIEEVVEEEEEMGALFDEEDDEFMNKGAILKGKGKKGKRKEKVTAEMKREARRQRETARLEKAAARRRDKEEIFEVGEEGMTLHALAELLQVDESDIVRSLFMRGIALSMSQTLDKSTVKLVASDYDVVVVDRDPVAVTDASKKRTEYISEEDVDELAPRPPVVTVMGHVDHGKTSLLDYIRKKRVAAGEAGGITQAIGAYNTEVEVDGERKTICFLDTPGHEAFSAMRARGTQVTDIAIIIVAADDGVRPQTREAVAHAQAAGVPIVVAINKVDKPGADVERVKQELLELNLVPEEWGGSTPMVPVSAKKGTSVPDLLTQLLWVADEKQLMSNPSRPARGTVIEANLDKKRGAVATLLVQVGTLRPGDVIRSGASYGRVRSLTNDLGQSIVAAGPSIAVQMTGFNSVPAAGEAFEVCASEQEAREAAVEFEDRLKLQRLLDMSGGGSMVTLASLATVDEEHEAMQRLNLIIKADTSGMVEAIKSALSMLPQQSVALRFLLAAPGEISVSDVDLAAASGAMVLAFNLEADDAVSSHAKRFNVSIKSYRIIYELLDDVKAAMEGKLKLVEERVPQGFAVVKAVFGTGKKRVAGTAVTEGKLAKGAFVTVKRGSSKAVVYDGKLSSLRRVKDVVEEVAAGLECGVGCDGFTEWAEGDTIECYQLVTKSRRLEEARATTAVDVSTLQ